VQTLHKMQVQQFLSFEIDQWKWQAIKCYIRDELIDKNTCPVINDGIRFLTKLNDISCKTI